MVYLPYWVVADIAAVVPVAAAAAADYVGVAGIAAGLGAVAAAAGTAAGLGAALAVAGMVDFVVGTAAAADSAALPVPELPDQKPECMDSSYSDLSVDPDT